MSFPQLPILVFALGLAMTAMACDDHEQPDVDDDEMRHQLNSDFSAVEDSIEEQHEKSIEHLDRAHAQIEEAIDNAEKFSAEVFELEDETPP